MEIYTAIISGVIGLITGAVGSLIAPWVHWGIEKKKGGNMREEQSLLNNGEKSFQVKISPTSNFLTIHYTVHCENSSVRKL